MWPFGHREVAETRYDRVGGLPFPARDMDIWVVADGLPAAGSRAYGEMERLVREQEYTLRSFGSLFPHLTEEMLRYNFPDDPPSLALINEKRFTDAIGSALGLRMKPGFLYFLRYDGYQDCFFVAEYRFGRCRNLKRLTSRYLLHTPVVFSPEGFTDFDADVVERGGDIRFRKAGPPEGPAGDDVQELAADVEAKIRQLLMHRFPVEVIETWLQTAAKPSRLLVTADHRILLSDYDTEIRLRQLPKALFLFFLRHEEGCRLKDLRDHREELLDIYWTLTNQEDARQVEKSIDSLVDPFSNSFNEKCSAIKSAFLSEISERYARYYYIQGPQGDVKRITLDRALVRWEDKP